MGQFISTTKLKKAQVWSADAIVAGVIFLVGIAILYFYIINYTSQASDKLDELLHEGTFASKILLSEDGILTNGKINQSKLEDFYSLAYDEQRKDLGVINDFYFSFEGMEISGSPVSYVGKLNSGEENLVKIIRITVYEDKPTKLNLYTWS